MTGKLLGRAGGFERTWHCLLLKTGRTAWDGARVIRRWEMTRGAIEPVIDPVDTLAISITTKSEHGSEARGR